MFKVTLNGTNRLDIELSGKLDSEEMSKRQGNHIFFRVRDYVTMRQPKIIKEDANDNITAHPAKSIQQYYTALESARWGA